MVRYAHFRGIVKEGQVFVNEKGSGCLLQIKGITLHFGAKMIFNDLSLEIRPGECLVLLGPSGIGKSTSASSAPFSVGITSRGKRKERGMTPTIW